MLPTSRFANSCYLHLCPAQFEVTVIGECQILVGPNN